VPSPFPSRNALVAAIFVAGLVVAGCARKAPGPEECHELARVWVAKERTPRTTRFGTLVLEPSTDTVLERTTECLTMPYDRELVQCIEEGLPPRGCYAAFQARKSKRE
jgi:hypothetical protein